jgi:hypothetical protein
VVPHSAQNQAMCGRPLLVGSARCCVAPRSSSIRSASISAFTANAEPVWRWQSLQWQQRTNIGAPAIRYRTGPQAHPPSCIFMIRALFDHCTLRERHLGGRI